MPTNKKGYMKEYYHNNKEKFLKYNSIDVKCEICNKSVKYSNLLTHCKSKIHLANFQIKNLELKICDSSLKPSTTTNEG